MLYRYRSHSSDGSNVPSLAQLAAGKMIENVEALKQGDVESFPAHEQSQLRLALHKKRMDDARLAAAKRREAFKRQKDEMSSTELTHAMTDRGSALLRRGARALDNMEKALEREGVAEPKMDPRYREFAQNFLNDFKIDSAKLHKKFRPTRRNYERDANPNGGVSIPNIEENEEIEEVD